MDRIPFKPSFVRDTKGLAEVLCLHVKLNYFLSLSKWRSAYEVLDEIQHRNKVIEARTEIRMSECTIPTSGNLEIGA